MIVNKDVIKSRNNPFVKWVCTLQDKKGREQERRFMAEGHKLVFEAISAGLPVTDCIIMQSKVNEYTDKLYQLLECEGFEETCITVVDDSVFEKISTEKAPQGLIAIIKYLDNFKDMDIIYKEDFFLEHDEKAIILCSLRDPSNLGAVVRSAVAFGKEHIILTNDCADVYNTKTIRSAMGSLFRVKVTRVGSLADAISGMRDNGRRVYAAELTDRAVSLKSVDLSSKDVFIIGNEGHGIPGEISEMCDASVFIPISTSTESLNASVAASIIMWEQSK